MRTATNVTVRVVNYKPSEVASVALSFEGCATLGKSASILTLEGPDGGRLYVRPRLAQFRTLGPAATGL